MSVLPLLKRDGREEGIKGGRVRWKEMETVTETQKDRHRLYTRCEIKLFADNPFIANFYIDNSKKFIKKLLLWMVREFSSIAGCKPNIQKFIIFINSIKIRNWILIVQYLQQASQNTKILRYKSNEIYPTSALRDLENPGLET